MSLELVTEPSKQANAVVGASLQTRRDIETRFRPGTSGNPGGRPRTAMFRRRAIKHLKLAIADGVDQLDAVIDAQVQTAAQGDTAAFNAIRDTVDGKPGNSDTGAGPTHISIEVVMVGQ